MEGDVGAAATGLDLHGFGRPAERGRGLLAGNRHRFGSLALALLPWFALLLAWSLVHALGLVDAALLPSPAAVLARAWSLTASGELFGHLLASTLRVTAGVLIGTTLAVPMGFLLGRITILRTVLEPLIGFFRALPPIALIPLVIVYFGIGEEAKLIVLSFAAFFASVIVLYEGIAQIAPIYVQVSRTLGASEAEVFRRVILPLTMPHLMTALRLALGVTWATLVAAELVAAQQGLGAMIQVAASFFQLDVIYVGIISIGATALLMDRGLKLLSARLLHWQERLHP